MAEVPSDEQIVALLEHSIQRAAGSIRRDAKLRELEGWDSMGMVALIGEVFERFQVELGVDQLDSCTTVADLVGLVQQTALTRPR